ncbi:TrmB family transcriptional regulator [Halorubrum ejinorense]|uniref:TrmB family transcriptional regulator n=1 Tax=Halorubrum ejinorense TaxID=425309 RepID=A0AAV3SS26_9EURY
MPMEIDEFEEETNGEELTTGEAIVEFLLENDGKAWKRSEIAEAIDRDPNTVATNLSRLKSRGLVRHRKNHWAITNDRERLDEAIRFSNALTGLNEAFGPIIESEEDAQAWSESQPDEPHPSEVDDEEVDETRTIEIEDLDSDG